METFSDSVPLLCFYCYCNSFQTLPSFIAAHTLHCHCFSFSLVSLQCYSIPLVYAPPPWLCVGRSNSQWLASCPIKVLVNFTLEVFLSSRLWNPAWRWNFTQFWRIKPQHPLRAIHNLWSHAKYSSSINKGKSNSWFYSNSPHYSQHVDQRLEMAFPNPW